MIPVEEKEMLISNVDGEAISYKIDESSHHIFSILRDKLYSNGRESLVRELMSNARDSHIEAGKADVPIKVWLPGSYLTIEDEGVGLSKERMAEVFCYYGRSTKRNTNAESGMFGLGAKSFFAYSSSASITSYYDGVKYEYAAYINESQVGEIKLISEGPTDRINGVAIKIPIKPEDARTFRDYVKKYAQFWDVPPTLFGDNIFGPINPPEILLSGTNWRMYKDGNLSKFNVLLDGIPYDYNMGYGNGCDGVTFIFKSGDGLVPSATRESIRKCDESDKIIGDAIKVFKAEIHKNIEDKIASCDDFVEVIKAIQSSKKFFQLSTKKWKWSGGTLEYPYEDNSILRCRKDYGALRKYTTKQFEDVTPDSFILVPEDFDYCDVKGYTSRRVNFYKKDKGLNTVYLVKPSHGVPDKLTVKLENIKIPSYNAGVKAPRIKNAPKTNIYVKYRGKANRTIVDIDRTNKNDLIYTTGDITTFYNQYKGMGHIPIACVEVQEKDIKLVKGKPGWSTIQEYIEEKLTKSLTKEKIELEYRKYEAADAYYSYSYLKDYLHEDFKVAFEPTSLTQEQISLVKFIQLNGELEKPEVPDLFARYPLLKVIEKHEVDKIPGETSYYYNVKIELANVVQYIQLINGVTAKENANV